MKQLIYNAQTKEETIIELPDEPITEPQPSEPTLEERVAQVETDTDEIVNVLAEIVGVQV